MNVEIKQLPKVRVAYLRHIGPYRESQGTWQALMGLAGPKGLLRDCQMMGLSHDDPESCAPEELRYDACISVDKDFSPFDSLQVKEIGGGSYAMAIHTGPYDTLAETYAALCGQWIPAQKIELRDTPCVEIYRNSLANAKPSELITEIYIPIEDPS